MIRKVLGAKIHRATVTQSNLDYEGSIVISTKLMQAAGLLPYEAVNVWNIASGTRFETYAIAGPEDSTDICVNGAAAHLVSPGDLIIIARFIWLNEFECQDFQPKIIFVDANNQITSAKSKETKLKAPARAH